MRKALSLLVLFAALLLIIFSIYSASPPALKTGIIADTAFSVERAFSHLKNISKAPHSTGTNENAHVRAYIIAACNEMGFDVQVQNTTAFTYHGSRLAAGNIYNIIAQKKGIRNSKAVMLMAHYDSEPNTPAAGDDGAAVAAMLETARALSKTTPLQNDVILLFTDGEEVGLLGAQAFVEESPLLKEVGLVINFEGRGNAGPSNMFEVNAENGWVVSEYAKSAAHPFANSLGYEIYKKLPNITDFTLFKNAGITGLNNAYIDGFVNYHSPTDNLINLDRRSLQHHGENMLSLVKHFGNLSITNTKAPDISYFNVVGYWFVHYPASWNLILVVIVNLLFLAYLAVGISKRQIKLKSTLISLVLFPVFLALSYFAANFLRKFIISKYPLYTHFDGNNSYNSGWYFLAMTAMCVTIFSILYTLAARKINIHSLLAGTLFTLIVLTDLVQYAIPSASYLLFVPILFILGIHVLILTKPTTAENQSLRKNGLSLLSVVPSIFLFSTTIYFTFIAFALSEEMPFVTIAVGLFCAMLLPVFYPAFKIHKLVTPVASLVCVVAALSVAHFQSGYSQKQPLQSSVFYQLDADSSQAKWVSDFKKTDKWSAQFFKAPIKQVSGRFLAGKAPLLNLPVPQAIVRKDSVDSKGRLLLAHFKPVRQNTISLKFFLSPSVVVHSFFVNGRETITNKSDKIDFINFEGIPETGLDILFSMPVGQELKLSLRDRSPGLPMIQGFTTSYPGDIVPAQGGNSNTTQVTKNYTF